MGVARRVHETENYHGICYDIGNFLAVTYFGGVFYSLYTVPDERLHLKRLHNSSLIYKNCLYHISHFLSDVHISHFYDSPFVAYLSVIRESL